MRLRKSKSIQRMEVLGLNTLDYFITKDAREITHYLAKHIGDYLSLRTERGVAFHCPFYYMLKGKDLLPLALKHLEEGYTLIISLSLDTKGCSAFGTFGYHDSEDNIIEYVVGEGKVRELDNHPNRETVIVPPDRMVPVSTKDAFINTMLNTLYKDTYERVYEHVPCIVEWSYYNYNVGALQKREIFWEIRPWNEGERR